MSEKKTKRKYYDWKGEDLKEALTILKNNVLGLNEYSRVYGIPKPTLKRHQAKHSHEINKGRPTIFSESEENELVQHILNMEECMFGFTPSDVRRLAYQVAEKNNIQHNFNRTNQMAGKCWYYKFMRRHSELSLRQPEATSINRIKGFNKENVMNFYDILEKILNDTNLSANDVFNVDETGFSTVQKRTQKVIGQRGKKQIGSVASGERGVNTTAVCAASASGQFIPPMIIFKRKRMCPQLKNGAPPGSVITISDTGYINSELFVDWLNHFIDIVKPTKEKKVLLLLDGHTTHSKNLEAIKIARENGVILLQLPGHTTHRLQPLDVALFAPLGIYYIQEVETWMRSNSGKPVTQYEVTQLFNRAYQRAATVGNVVSGFKATGIWPVNRHIFQDHHFLAAETFQPNDVRDPSSPAPANKDTLNLNQTQNTNNVEETKSDTSDVTECESPSLIENSPNIWNITSSVQGPKYKQPDSLITTALNHFNDKVLAAAQYNEVHLPENRIDHEPNDAMTVQLKSRSSIDIVNLGASTSTKTNTLSRILKVPIKNISPLPKNKQIYTRKRGIQKTVELTASPYKNDLEESIKKREARKPKIKFEEDPVKKKIKREDKKTDTNKNKRKIKKLKKYESNKNLNKKASTQNKKKRKLAKKSETESSETEEEIILDDDTDVELEEEYDENYCSICNGYYFDKKAPKVDWFQCVRCHKWLHITCSINPDICPRCLK